MDWLDVTDDPLTAIRTLRMILDRHYPADARASARCSFVDEHGVERVFLVGAIDCTSELVAWQRRQWVIAVAQRSREPGRMIVAAPGPISLAVAQRILAHSFLIEMGEPLDSFGGAVRSSRSTGSYYDWEVGSACTLGWEFGLGAAPSPGRVLQQQQPSTPRAPCEWLPPNQVATMIAIAER